MKIERTDKEIIIRIPSDVNIDGILRLMNCQEFEEATSKSKAKQKDIDAPVKENKAAMKIERTDKEIIIRIPSDVNIDDTLRLMNCLQFKEATSKSKAKQKDIDALVKEVKKGSWWVNNRMRLAK